MHNETNAFGGVIILPTQDLFRSLSANSGRELMNKLILAAFAIGAAGAANAQSSGTDARGIPVVSAPATAPTGANQTVSVPPGATVTINPNQSSVFTPMAASGEMPACTREVTDHCTQTYEGRGGGKMMSHHRGHGGMMKHGKRRAHRR